MATIRAQLSDGTAVKLSNGEHEWRADEPSDVGGTGSGPNPYELLLGSLAACTCITLAMYCRHKGIALRSVSASYEFDRVHADDCAECDDDATGRIERIESHVHIEGDFDDAQRKRLAQVVEHCPVHKTLAKGIVFADHATFAGS